MSAVGVSVVVPTFNRGAMLEECLESILGQTVAPTQVIVVDDGSTDDTPARVARLGPCITYLRKENGGKACALNLALPLIEGEVTWLFDDDDIALPTSLERRLTILEGNPYASMVVSNHLWGETDADGRVRETKRHTWPPVSEQDFLLRLMQGCFVTLQGALVRTTCYAEVGPFNEEFVASEDYEMLIRLARRYPVALLDEPTFIFRRHTGARGPAHHQYAARERQRVFARFDRLLGEQLRREVPLGDFLTPPVHGPLSLPQERAAVVARMSVMASKGLWSEMLEDAAAYVNLVNCGVGGREIMPIERGQIIGAAQARYFALSVLTEPAEFVDAAARMRSSSTGRTILRWLARGLLGVARWGTGGARERCKALFLAARLAMKALL